MNSRELSSLAGRLEASRASHHVPGTCLTVVRGADGENTFASGHLRAGLDHAVGAGTQFEVGSVTKVLTAALVMQLADEQRVDLDAPIQRAIPGFSRGSTRDLVTPRHLLTHSAGFEGDIFTDTGEGDDCVEKYVDALADAPQYFTPGTVFSYSNAGFVVLGRIVELLRGSPFDRALVDHLSRPLGLKGLTANPNDEARTDWSSGHRRDPESGTCVPTDDRLPRALSPAGTRLRATAPDLARLALAIAGAGPQPVLSPVSAGKMLADQEVDVPDLDGDWPQARGLGWEIEHTDGHTVWAHDGDTIGHTAFVRVIPQESLAVVLLTNGGDARGLYNDIVPGLLRELGGAGDPLPPRDVAVPDVSTLVGRYAGDAGEYLVRGTSLHDLVLDRTPRGLVAEYARPSTGRLRHVRGATFRWEDRKDDQLAVAFGPQGRSGSSTYLHNGRAHPRIGR